MQKQTSLLCWPRCAPLRHHSASIGSCQFTVSTHAAGNMWSALMGQRESFSCAPNGASSTSVAAQFTLDAAASLPERPPKRSCVSVLVLGNAPPAPPNTGPALQVLLNHVVAQELSAVDLNVRAAETVSVRTLDGEEQIINTPGAGIFIQSSGLAPPGSLIITPDVEICAGIIHIVNKVLLTAPYQAVAPPGPSAGDTPMPTAQV